MISGLAGPTEVVAFDRKALFAQQSEIEPNNISSYTHLRFYYRSQPHEFKVFTLISQLISIF